MYKRKKLKNGLRIITKRSAGVHSVSLGIWINIGSRYELPEQKGISHFLEHLLFKGSKKYSCRSIKESIEGVGGSLNGFTSEEHTCYLVKIPHRYLLEALDILSDMVINPCLTATDIHKEKTVVLEELKMYRDLPQSYVNELLDELLWPRQALGSPVIGTVETVNSIDRKVLKSFQSRHYTPENMVISAAGLLEDDLLASRVSEIFSPLKNSGLNTFIKARQSQDKPQLKIFHKGTEQTHMAMGFHALKRDHPLRHAQAILHIILGGNMSSRLFNEVREKRGLAYEIGTGLKRYNDTGVFLVHAGIDNLKVQDCLGLILQELGKTKKTLVTKDEFKRAKEFYQGQLSLALEDTMEYMLWMGESIACLDKVYSLDQIIKEVNRVCLEDVRLVARQIFRQEIINLALIGPLGKNEKQIYHKLNLRQG
ncbi:MAG TPA: pitrilysin family protein [Candidatus Omnitrophota bacterium]|nr:pitrilysin family protein [Candidatus Omnitrophota bacterium]